VTALATVGTAAWLVYIDLDPKVTIPNPVSISPNAHNVLLQAANAIPAADRPQRIGEGATMSGPDRIAIALDGSPNVSRLDPHSLLNKPPASNSIKPPPYTLAESKMLLREYSVTRSLVREALTQPYQAPPIRSMYATMPYLTDYRKFARLLALEAKVKAAEGDYAGAVNSGLDAVELGEHIQHGGSMINKLVGIACEAIGRAQIWQHIDRLSAAEARAAAKRVEHIMSEHVPFAETLVVEKYGTLANMQELFNRRDWRVKWTDVSDGTSNPSPGLASYFKLLPHSKREIVERYTRMMDQSILRARRPYFAIVSESAGKGGQDLYEQRIANEAAADPVNALFFPVFSQARFQDEIGTVTQNSLLAAKLAVRAYYADHHRYPRSVSELVPAYLKSVPQDPFANSQALRYRMASVDGAPVGPVIYSVGPDLRDDGGNPATDPEAARHYKDIRSLSTKERAAVRIVRATSTGDIVAGANTK
jgi:hypothetical protein